MMNSNENHAITELHVSEIDEVGGGNPGLAVVLVVAVGWYLYSKYSEGEER